MYSLKNHVNSGIQIDLDLMLKCQQECWLEVCRSSSELMMLSNSDEFIMCKNGVLRYLQECYPKLLSLLTRVSGEVDLTSRRLHFFRVLCGFSDSKDMILIEILLRNLEKFDCYQSIYNQLKRKRGIGTYLPKIVHEPTMRSKVYDGDLSILTSCLLGDNTIKYNVGKYLAEELRRQVGLCSGERLLLNCSDILTEEFEESHLDIILEFADKDESRMFLNPKLVNFVHKFTERTAMGTSGNVDSFFYLFSVRFMQSAMETSFSRCKKDLSEKGIDLLSSQIMLTATEICVKSDTPIMVERSSSSHAISPYCVDENECRLPIINNYIGYVGQYVDSFQISKFNMVSEYNPVVMFFPRVRGKVTKFEPRLMYSVSWLRDKDSSQSVSVFDDTSVPYLGYAFSVSDLVLDEGYNEDFSSYLNESVKIVLGDKSYRTFVKNRLSQSLRVLVDTKLCLVNTSLDGANLLNTEESECFSDTDELLKMILD